MIAAGAETPYPRAARINLAKLEADAGALDRARQAYDRLLAEDAEDAIARQGRAVLNLRRGQPAAAEADLDLLLKDHPRPAELLVLRAVARLALGRPAEAEADAAEAVRLDPRAARQRLWIRTRLAAGLGADLRLDDPAEVAALPVRGPALTADLRRAAEQLRAAAAPSLTRAALLSALNDAQAAEDEASRAVATSPVPAHALLVRARIRRRAGDRDGALEDVRKGLALDHADPRLWEFWGVLRVEEGRLEEGLADLNAALRLGAEGPAIRGARARALSALGRDTEALADWTRALARDPEDAWAYLGRAGVYRRLGQFGPALADLEQAVGLASDRPEVLAAAALSYTSCLPARPDRLRRVVALALRAGALKVLSAEQ